MEMAQCIEDSFFKQIIEEKARKRKFDAFEFPKVRTEDHRKAFERYLGHYRNELDFEVRGLDNIEREIPWTPLKGQ